MGSRGAGSGRKGSRTAKGMTAAEEQKLHDLAISSLVWRDDYAKTNVTTAEEREKYRTSQSGGHLFAVEQFNTLQKVAERNGIASEFDFDEVRSSVHTPDLKFQIFGDDYAIARNNNDRKWVVNEFDRDSKEFYKPIIEQTRFSTPQAALDFVAKKYKKGK